jgi:hypothetical protein
VRRLSPAGLALAAVIAALPTAAQDADLWATLHEAARPGPMHRELARLAGSWQAEGRYWLPSGKSVAAAAKIESTLLQDGRFLEARVSGTLQGEPYEGRGLLGFDTAAGEFVEIWLDSLATGIHRATGSCDTGCRIRTMTSQFVDPVWGRTMRSRSQVTWLGEESYRFEAWLAHEDGREFRQLEYTARRAR